ncbi:MAG: hypothetical protein IT162_04140 [Bryobacterales bacterium]|nr:hypothetical protein [Bryobacterales bacterium]
MSGTVGATTFLGSIGTFAVNVTTGTSKPVLAPGQMDLNSINVATGVGGTLDIFWSDDSFDASTAVGGYRMDFGGTVSTNGTITAAAYYDAGNVLFAQTTQVGVLGPFTSPAPAPVTAFAGTVTGPGPTTAPYSLTQHLRIVFTGAGSFSGDFSLTPVPEPDAVALAIGVALLGVAGLRRKMA